MFLDIRKICGKKINNAEKGRDPMDSSVLAVTWSNICFVCSEERRMKTELLVYGDEGVFWNPRGCISGTKN